MSNLYLLNKIGIEKILERIDDVIGYAAIFLGLYKCAQTLSDISEKNLGSPFVPLGRFLEVGGLYSSYISLLTDSYDDIYKALAPAALGLTIGAFWNM